jgi:hypothetical protein
MNSTGSLSVKNSPSSVGLDTSMATRTPSRIGMYTDVVA